MAMIARPRTDLSLAAGAESRDAAAEQRGWRGLLRAGALAAFGVIAFVPIQLAVLIIWPIPTSILAWFARFQENAIAGLLDMDLLMLADYVFFALLFVALSERSGWCSPSLRSCQCGSGSCSRVARSGGMPLDCAVRP